jgi:hypothetical protein
MGGRAHPGTADPDGSRRIGEGPVGRSVACGDAPGGPHPPVVRARSSCPGRHHAAGSCRGRSSVLERSGVADRGCRADADRDGDRDPHAISDSHALRECDSDPDSVPVAFPHRHPDPVADADAGNGATADQPAAGAVLRP